MADVAATTKTPTAEEVKSWLKEQVLPVLRAEVAPLVSDIVDERVRKALEKAKPVANSDMASLVDGSNVANNDIDLPLPVRQRKAARYLLALAASRGSMDAAIAMGKRMRDPFVEKALGESALTTGGFMVPLEVGEFISSLGAGTVVRQLGARTVRMASGQMMLPGGNTGATMNWVGENTVAGSSQPAGRQVNLSAKKGMVIVPISNDMLADAGGAAQEWVQSEATSAYDRGEDYAYIRGLGTEYSPMGMLYQVLAANKNAITHAGATATIQEIWTDLGKLILKLANGNVPMVRCGWIFAKRTEWYLKTLISANSLPVFPDLAASGTLFGFKFGSTTQIPITLSTDESEVYFADFQSLIIGESGELEIDVIKGAAYYDTTTGAVVSGVSQDQTTLVLKRRVDFKSLYGGKDIAVATGVDWGTGL